MDFVEDNVEGFQKEFGRLWKDVRRNLKDFKGVGFAGCYNSEGIGKLFEGFWIDFGRISKGMWIMDDGP